MADGNGVERARRRDEGFALAAVLLTLVVLGALASAGLILTRTDVEISVNHRASVEAANVAERGLVLYLAEHGRMGGDTTYVFGSDSALVSVTRLLETDTTYRDTLFRLVSRGVRRAGGRRAVRTHDRLVMDRSDRMALQAAVTSSVATEVSGNAQARGDDACSLAEVAGLALPAGGYFLGDQANVQGSPAVDSSGAGPAAVLQGTGVDWAAIVRDTLLEPDYWIPAGSWPDFSTLPPDAYPAIRISDPDFTLSGVHSGRGTIVADGNVSLSGSFSWDGLLLAGGSTDAASGNARVHGAVVGGLNVLLGGNPGASTVTSSGSAEIRYDSCEIRDAVAAGVRWLAEVPGSRSEVMVP